MVYRLKKKKTLNVALFYNKKLLNVIPSKITCSRADRSIHKISLTLVTFNISFLQYR